MRIRRGCRIDFFLPCIGNHFQKILVQIRFALKIKSQINKFIGNLINRFLKEIFFEHAYWSCERTQATRTFRTAQVAGSSWFKRNGKWHSKLNRLFQIFRQIKRKIHQTHIPHSSNGEFRYKVECVLCGCVHC